MSTGRSIVDTLKETTGSLHHGHTSVGMEPVRISDLDYRLNKGVLLQASPGNEYPVYIGGRNVLADNTPNGGLPLIPGQALFMPLDKINSVWAVSTHAGQDIAWIAG